MKNKSVAFIALASGLACSSVLLISGQSSAAFYDYGQGVVYDSTLNITWMKDANLLGTQLASNPSLINDIIIANGGGDP